MCIRDSKQCLHLWFYDQLFYPLQNHRSNRSPRPTPVSYTHLRAHETPEHLVCRLLLSPRDRWSAASDVYKGQQTMSVSLVLRPIISSLTCPPFKWVSTPN